jgi:hypothetical protein
METEKYVRTPISLEQLFKLDNDMLDEHDLYAKKDIVKFDINTLVYLDDLIDVDDDTDDEIYPSFALDLNLQWLFSGQVISDIIVNTQHQLTNPTVNDYIKNFIYYHQHDCFITF